MWNNSIHNSSPFASSWEVQRNDYNRKMENQIAIGLELSRQLEAKAKADAEAKAKADAEAKANKTKN